MRALWAADGLLCAGERLLVHSAHIFTTSLESFRLVLGLLEGSEELSARIRKVTRTHGEEGSRRSRGALAVPHAHPRRWSQPRARALLLAPRR